MKKPNFFILGAPKCGTTSMDAWLSEHPSIYMAEKEPHYFDTDLKNRKTKDLDVYNALFESAVDSHLAVGETSVRYLYSQDAVANILNYNPNVKFIVMLRNPIDMAYSWHNQIYFSGLEDVKSFTKAWHLQDNRLLGKNIHKYCAEPKMLNYGAVCSLGEQLQRLYNQVSPGRVCLIFFDDLERDAQQAYQLVLNFLGVADNHKKDFNIYNPSENYRIASLKNVPIGLGKIKTKLGIKCSFGILEFMRAKNKKVQKRKPLSQDMRKILIDYFSDDINLLAQLTGRNLEHWLK